MKKMKKSVSELLETVKKDVKEMINNNPYGYSEGISDIAMKIEKTRRYLTKDYETGINHLTNEELDLYKSSISDDAKQQGSQILDTSRKIIEKAKEYRRESNKKTNKVETNILTHAPYFLGGTKKRKEQAKKEGYIKINKKGIHDLTYENKLGHMLTMNDAKTLFALFSMWEDQNYGEWVTFTEYQIIDKLNLQVGGSRYETVRNSLEKLRNTSVVMQDAYDIEIGKRVQTERFDLIIADSSIVDFNKAGDVQSKQYRIQCCPYTEKSIKKGYYTFISIAAFNELEVGSAQALYVLLSGMTSMEKRNKYIRPDGMLEISLQYIYDTLFLEGENFRNKITIEKGCEELKSMDIIRDFKFTKKGRSYDKLIVEQSDWLIDVLKNKKEFPMHQEQLTFSDI